MITIRKSAERGRADYGWLDTRYTFSFADYHDPRHMGFRALRVINEDVVAPGEGFPTHGHRDMEIVTYVLAGAIEHKDSLGTGAVLRPGEVQRMSAGRGVTHSEFNPSRTEPLHLLQIWLMPEKRSANPEYEQKAFALEGRRGKWQLFAARNAREGSVAIHADVELLGIVLAKGASASRDLAPGRHAWLQVARGTVMLNGVALNGVALNGVALNGVALSQGDGAALSNEARIEVEATEDAELLLFDLA